MSCAPKLYVIQYSHVFTRFQILGSNFFYHFCLVWAGEVPNSWPGSQEYPKQYGLPGNDPEYVERCRRLLPLGPKVPVVPAPFAVDHQGTKPIRMPLQIHGCRNMHFGLACAPGATRNFGTGNQMAQTVNGGCLLQVVSYVLCSTPIPIICQTGKSKLSQVWDFCMLILCLISTLFRLC